MDEISMLRELLDDGEPSAKATEEGRTRLLAASAHPAWWRRRMRLWTATAFGVTGASAAAIAAFTMLGSAGGSAPERSLPGSVAPPSTGASAARDFLLAASVHAASAPTHGRYWHVRSMSKAPVAQRFGHDGNRYVLEELSVSERWTTRAGRSWLGRRDWVRPKTAQDAVAWKRAGSPDHWCIGQTDTSPPQRICLRTGAGTTSLTPIGQDTFHVSERLALTFAQLQRLPRTARALRAKLTSDARRGLDPSASTAIVDLNVEEELANLLVDFPVPSAVRAAAFRALADMPGVSSSGRTTDQIGRWGVAITIHGPGTGVLVSDGGSVTAVEGTISRTLIIDPKTSQILADETTVGRRAQPTIDTTVLSAGWTNDPPRTPAKPAAARRSDASSSV